MNSGNHRLGRDQVLKPLIEDGLIEMTIPDKPRSSRQKYRLTKKGREEMKPKEWEKPAFGLGMIEITGN